MNCEAATPHLRDEHQTNQRYQSYFSKHQAHDSQRSRSEGLLGNMKLSNTPAPNALTFDLSCYMLNG